MNLNRNWTIRKCR